MIITFLQKSCSVLFCIGVMIMQPSCLRDSYWVKISSPLTIGDEWVELHPKSPLKAEKTFQWVALDLEPPFKEDLYNEGRGPNSGKGILMPDGEVINPEIEAIDQYGNAFNLGYRGAREGDPIYGYNRPDELPRDREYKTVRIRSSRPIKCKAIYWFCESSKDWK